MLTRREFLSAGGLALAGLAMAPIRAKRGGVEIYMWSDAQGANVGFDPIGVFIEPGQTVRWIVMADNIHTTTAYHPANDLHCLRIPEGATPWGSDFLMRKGDHFDLTLTLEGVYDYFCMPHEEAGMVGRIVVGKPGGPGALPFDYFEGRPGAEKWKPVPLAARRTFPSIDLIVKQRIVRPDELLRSGSHLAHTGREK